MQRGGALAAKQWQELKLLTWDPQALIKQAFIGVAPKDPEALSVSPRV